MPFSIGKGSRAALEGASREHRGSTREHGGATREHSEGAQGHSEGARLRRCAITEQLAPRAKYGTSSREPNLAASYPATAALII